MTRAANLAEKKRLHRKAALRTVAFYAALAILWIYCSDMVLALFISDPQRLTQVQTIKGALFVVVTTGLLYLFLTNCLRILRMQEEALAEEREQAHQEVEEQFRQLNTLFDSLNAVVYVADMESYEILYANRFVADCFGDDWHGQKCYHYLQDGSDEPCRFCTNPQLLADGKPGDPVVWEFQNTRNKRWYECFDKALYWTDGRLARLEVAFDITERKELEQIKDDLLSSMSHEMRTPLTAVSGFAELLLNEAGVPAQHKHHIEIIHREAEKLTELINRFLDVRRLKVNRARVNYQYFPLRTLLEQAIKSSRDCKGHHQVSYQCPPEVELYGNRKELGQAVGQLLENACRYSPNGGEIGIKVNNDSQQTAISIKDQGIGIPEHEFEAIFKPFHRLDTGDSRSTGGVGLGLCVAKEIVSLHGGYIDVASTLGEGSTFTVFLPAMTPSDETPAEFELTR